MGDREAEQAGPRVEIRGLTVDANIYRQDDYYNPRAIVVEHGHL
ncbi:MAG: hypothetical protein Ct9H300mP1_38880 [Planctomycetaceae bacterium]|nr:MAG: hypothetical protein Ct9H300mP1_38880 [Planctomycetaceae bacterium]